jgi:thioester reductase-like protein
VIRKKQPIPLHEPIAIVGIGLRFPGGAVDPASFWEFLLSGGDGVGEIPPERWSIQSFHDTRVGIPGKSHSKWGGFIEGNDLFDPSFFSISPQEAIAMDPQQRLVLETTWHAFENSGRIPDPAARERIGVWVGVSLNDYNRFAVSPIDHIQSSTAGSGAYDATGNAFSIVANRVSHFFNLTGPSMAVDTACSSSLVALNEACRAIWDDECDSAVVAGVNHIVDPTTWIAFSALGALSPTGRCKSFDASADGFVRSEGVGVVVLKPLSAAIADGDRIYANICAVATNQDGRTPAIAMPSKVSQRALIEHTLELAGLAPKDIDFVEAHGTGTAIGDPIEANAIGEALACRRNGGRPLYLGSVKTNIGHLESAAGIAGLIKTALALHHRVLPANLHFESPNPGVDFEGMGLEVPVASVPLTFGKAGRTLRAGVNSFGFGGANAHAILESVTPGKSSPLATGTSGPGLLTFSAASATSLRRLASSYADRLQSGAGLADLQRSARAVHGSFPFRLAVHGDSSEQIFTRLKDFSESSGENILIPGIETGRVDRGHGQAPVFVFSGQGSQWSGMGRRLHEHFPVFRAEFDRIASALKRVSKGQLDLSSEPDEEALAHTALAQPALFAIQVATARLLESWGIHPAAVVGHSVGEVAAAHLTGALSFSDAVRVIYHRGSKMESTRAGRMVAVEISPDEASAAIARLGGDLALAAKNGPRSVSVSGPVDEIERFRSDLESQGIPCRTVPVDYAFHSSLMAPAEAKLVRALEGITPQRTRIPLYSTVTGKTIAGTRLGPNYWWHNVRDTVKFTEAMSLLGEQGHRLFLEINAHPVLQPSMRQHAFEVSPEGHKLEVLGTLRKERDDIDELLAAVAKLYCLGSPVDSCAISGEQGLKSDPPLYPFDRRSFWRETPAWRLARTKERPHPLLHACIPGPRPQWLVFLDRRHHPFFNDHLVGERIVFPASGYLEIALAVGRHHLGPGFLCLESIEFQRVLFLPHQGDAPLLRVEFNPENGSFAIHSSSDPDRANWTRHVVGKIRLSDPDSNPPDLMHFLGIHERALESASVAETYRSLKLGGLNYGPLFRGLSSGSWGGDECWSEIAVPPAALDGNRNESFLLHPVLLDSAFHILALKPNKAPGTFLPVETKRLRLYQTGVTAATAYARLTNSSESTYEADIVLLDRDGNLIADLRGFRLQAIESHRSRLSSGVANDFLEESWVREDPPQWTVSPPQFPSAETIVRRLAKPPRLWRKEVALLSEDSPVVAARLWLGLTEAGLTFPAGNVFSLDDVAAALNVKKPLQRKRLEGVFSILERAGFIKASTKGWIADRRRTPATITQLWSDALLGHPRISTELLHLDRAVRHFHSDLAGQNETSTASDRALFRESLWSRPVRESIVQILRGLITSLPEGRRLDILELDVADRSSADWYFSQLSEDRYRYLATDPDPSRLAEFAERIGHHDSLQCETFDPTKNLLPDKAIPASDVALHLYPRNLTASALRRVRGNLRPGGLLLLVTPAKEDDSAGLPLEGLEPFSSAPATMAAILEQAGFDSIVSRDLSAGPHRFWLARNPVKAKRKLSLPLNPPEAAPPFLVFADEKGELAEALADSLRTKGAAVTILPRCDVPRSREEAIELLGGLAPSTSIVYLAAVKATRNSRSVIVPEDAVCAENCEVPLFLAQALDRLGESSPGLSLHTFTTGLQSLPGSEEPPHLAHAALSGFMRVVRSELRRHRVVQLDLSAGPLASEIELAVSDLFTSSEEDQIAYRGESRWVPRLSKRLPGNQEPTTVAPLHDRPALLVSRQPGILEHLGLEACERTLPGRGEIEIEVHAAGVNFRDVMKALAIYPSDAKDARLLGDDFAGVVVSTGPGTKQLKPGDRVVGIFPGCFRTHLCLPENAVFQIPDALSFEEAATIPSVYLTAWIALHGVAKLRRGERVLVHAGAGGVGLAAIRLALRAGATVYATAGSEWKQNYLRTIGVEKVYSSRNLEFADRLLVDTGGEGVDIVLNSLAGEAIRKGLECLREGGRFLELGKRDIYGNTEIGLSPFKNCLSYHAIDLSRQFAPAQLRQLFTTLRKLVQKEEVRPLPHTVFPVASVAEAFRTMAQGKHLGKIVLSFEGSGSTPPAPFLSGVMHLDPRGVHLVTGGTRGFGLRTARFLASRGARHLVLAGLTGEVEPGGEEILRDIRALGAKVTVKACDMGDSAAVSALLTDIRKKGLPLVGVFHGAMVLDDEVLIRLTPERIHRVIRPKAGGAWNLHRLTLDDPLQHFVLFSSISVLLGNPGQSNYVAANAFLDTLATYRRHLGRPGLSVAFDRLADSGYASRNKALSEHFDRMGWKGLTDEAACRGLELSMENDASRLAISNIDWSRWRSAGGHAAKSPRYRLLVEESGETGDEELVDRIRQQFFAAPRSERAAVIEEFVARQVAKVLRIPPGRLSRDKPLNEQGLDSLMAVELFGVLENHLGVPIPPSQLIENPTIAKASAAITRVLETQDSEAPALVAVSVTPDEPLHDPEADRIELTAVISASRLPSKPAPKSPPAVILLTGATGFFGPYLLKALLDETKAKVICLVRDGSPEGGLNRIRRRLREAATGVTDDILRRRVEVVTGDTASPRLGLSGSDWTGLSRRVDTVVHAAATVAHASDYSDIRPANVLATKELIDFCLSAPVAKHLHFLSGVSVVGGVDPSTGLRELKSEHTPPDSIDSLYNAYGQSKAVSEHLLAAARDLGLSANVFRLAHLTSAVEPERSIRNQGVWLFVQACLVLGCAPRSDLNLQITPAPYSARRIARAIQDRLPAGVWHVVGSQSTPFDELISRLRLLGHDLEQLNQVSWLHRARTVISQNPAYAALMPDQSLLESNVSSRGLLADAEFRSVRPTEANEADDIWDPATFLLQLVPRS